ncbi:MAG: FlgD immunoglobulin-like domain containing protein [Candidatus Kryptoniota bacterium]
MFISSSDLLTSIADQSNHLESVETVSPQSNFSNEDRTNWLQSTELHNAGNNQRQPAMVKFLHTISGVQIYLSNSIPLLAIRIELEVSKDYQYVPPLLTNRVSHMQAQFSFQDRQLIIVLLDTERNGIDVGSGQIVNIPFPPDVDFNVNGVYGSLKGEETCELPYVVNKHFSKNNLIELCQNDPNPFAVSTVIRFRIGSTMYIKLLIYDINGGLIKTLLSTNLDAGEYTVTWDGTMEDGRNAESGVYLYKLCADANSMTRKMVLSR